MPEVEELLRRYASAAERSVPSAERRTAGRSNGTRRWLAVGAAAAVAVAALAVLLTEDEGTEVSTDPTATTPTSTSGPTTTVAPTSSYRTFPVVVVTDREYLVWSGEAGSEAAVRADGFAVDLRTGAVRAIPVAPLDPRSGATGVWTGEELLVCCGTGEEDGYAPDTASAAAWNPDSGEWRPLAAPPSEVARSYAASAWTGQLMVVVAPGGGAAAYDPADDAWEEIPAPPIRGRGPAAAWTGSEVILWDSVYGLDGGYRWTPGDDAWMALPPLPAGHRTQLGSMAWTGGEVVVWGQSVDDEALGVGARWRPGDDGWHPMAAWPHNPVRQPYNGTSGSQSVAPSEDGRVVVTGLDGDDAVHTDLYDPGTDGWLNLGFSISGFNPSVTVAGDLVLIPDQDRPIAGRLP